MRILIKGRNNYWRFTVYMWLLEIKGILEKELNESIHVEVIDGDSEDPEFYVDGYFIGSGVPGEEGYLIEILKKTRRVLRGSRDDVSI